MTDQHPTILALDVSSTHLGYVIYHAAVIDHGEKTLAGPIELRCRQAYNWLWLLLDRMQQPDLIAVESPVAQYVKALIPQVRVSGALLTLAGQRDIPVIEVSPAQAKRALAGSGAACKAAMQAAAARYGVSGEHASDALGVVLSAVERVAVVEEVASGC